MKKNNSVRVHYDKQLGPLYAWMGGDLQRLCQQNMAVFDRINIATSGRALDLGCGHGEQSLVLVERGYRVTAIDFCKHLLEQLKRQGGSLPITCHDADIMDFRQVVSDSSYLVVCMGDTLTHLSGLDAVERLVTEVAENLSTVGILVVSFRDYVTRELYGSDRFIPVRQDEDRIMTCFLEYLPDSVVVSDILHTREAGTWTQTISSYMKLRLDPDWLETVMAGSGLQLEQKFPDKGMLIMKSVKPG